MFSYVAGGGTPRVRCYANTMYKKKRTLNLRRDTDFFLIFSTQRKLLLLILIFGAGCRFIDIEEAPLPLFRLFGFGRGRLAARSPGRLLADLAKGSFSPTWPRGTFSPTWPRETTDCFLNWFFNKRGWNAKRRTSQFRFRLRGRLAQAALHGDAQMARVAGIAWKSEARRG